MVDNEERMRVVEHWMVRVSEDRGVHRLDDLHVNEIDSEWLDRSKWLDAGLASLRLALSIRAAIGLNHSVVLAFSLTDAPVLPISDRQALATLFDWSPPSLYLFDAGHEPWRGSGYTRVEPFDPAILGDAHPSASAFFAEFRQDTGEVCHVVYLGA
jgi:hypothetical protein